MSNTEIICPRDHPTCPPVLSSSSPCITLRQHDPSRMQVWPCSVPSVAHQWFPLLSGESRSLSMSHKTFQELAPACLSSFRSYHSFPWNLPYNLSKSFAVTKNDNALDLCSELCALSWILNCLPSGQVISFSDALGTSSGVISELIWMLLLCVLEHTAYATHSTSHTIIISCLLC